MEDKTETPRSKKVTKELNELAIRKNCEMMVAKASHLANHTTPAMAGPHTPGREKEIRELCVETIGVATEIVMLADNTVTIIDPK